MVDLEIKAEPNFPQRRNTPIAKLLVQFSKFKRKNKHTVIDPAKDGIEFIESVLEEFQINVEVDEEDLKRIPKNGPFIAVSNHPFGGIDVLLLIKLFTKIRPDFKVLVNKFIYEIEPIRSYLFSAGRYEKKLFKRLRISEIKNALNTLHQNNSLGVFPSGMVVSNPFSLNTIVDRAWDISTLKLIKKAGVPIVPVYFKGNQNWLFNIIGGIHPLFRQMRLPSDFFSKKRISIKIRIGNHVTKIEQDEFKDINLYRRYLRSRVYALGTSLEHKSFLSNLLSWRPKKVEPVIDPVPQDIIIQEINNIKENYLLFESGEFAILCAPSLEMPNILKEIGRLREITFREVGEGSNKSLDLDEYDLYYQQLIVWDIVNKKIAGAYRVGMGKEIVEQFGTSGFYISSLFKIKDEALPMLQESLELGRSFIVKEYQRKPLSLFLLWKGILYFLLKHNEYRYLVGPASISNEFSKFSKNLIVSFLKKYYFDPSKAQYFKPRKKFKIKKTKHVDQKLFLDIEQDIAKLDKFIFEIESDYGIPVLLKKYIKLNAKIIGFNVDPDFNNCLDGLVVVDIFDIPYETLKTLSKEINDESILDRFNQ
ncbi:MAG: lysophospholipid acyltransferase family protein [Bacteroidales bacterium]